MQRFIYCFMIFALSLATDVLVYNELFYFRQDAKPVFKSAAPWKFGFTASDWLYMETRYRNRPPSFTRVITTIDLVTVRWKMATLSNGEKAHVFVRQLSGTEVIMNTNLYTSNGLCRTIRFAEGRVISEKSEKEYKYTDICFKEKTKPCVVIVDLKDVICEGSSNVTQKNENVKITTTTPLTDLENNNTTAVSNVSPSPHETSTNSSANNTEVKTTDNTVIIIVGSLFGITLILLASVVIWKRCWSNHSPQGTSELPTNQNNQPFYVNLLFRRECNEEIAEMEEHHYEEINPQVSTEGS